MEPTYDAITTEHARLFQSGYPSVTCFIEEEIEAEIERINPDNRTVTVASLNGQNHKPSVITAWANVAKALGDGHLLTVGYQSLQIVREMNPLELRNTAVGTLQQRLYLKQREEAKQSLIYRDHLAETNVCQDANCTICV